MFKEILRFFENFLKFYRNFRENVGKILAILEIWIYRGFRGRSPQKLAKILKKISGKMNGNLQKF